MGPAFLSDDRVRLRPVEVADLPQLAAWRNDPEIRTRTREFRPLNQESQRRWFERISGPDSREFMFVVEAVTAWGDAVGVVGLCNYQPRSQIAETSFYIGPPNARRQGFAAASLRLLHGWGFGELGLNRIEAEVYAFNEPSIALLKKLGFIEEGRRRLAIWHNGARCDSLLFGLLRLEWTP